MTSDNTPAPHLVTTKQLNASYPPWYAFNADDVHPFWNSGSLPAWIVYKGEFPSVVTTFKYINSSSTAYWPLEFFFAGSNDGSTWTGLYSTTAAPAGNEWNTFTFENTQAFLYYRMYIETVHVGGGTEAQVAEIQLWGEFAVLTNKKIMVGGALHDVSAKVSIGGAWKDCETKVAIGGVWKS